MSAQKKTKKCPRCGSRNVEVEKPDGKGRVTVYCTECDYEFEIHDDKSSRAWVRGKSAYYE